MSGADEDFRRVKFQSPDAPDRKWLEWFREYYGRLLCRIDVEPHADSSFRMEVTTRRLPDLVIAHGLRSPMRTVYRGDDSGEISMVVLMAGTVQVQCSAQQNQTLTPGMAVMGRHEAPATIDVPAGARLLSIRMRRRLLEPLIRSFGSEAIIADSQALRLLTSYVQTVEAMETIPDMQMQHLVTTHIHDLVALAYGTSRDAAELIDARGKRAGRLAAIKRDIQSDLVDPRLSVTQLAARHGVSPRYIHMLFEREGVTFSEFVVSRRLTLAHRMLSDPRYEGLSISTIALAVGFGDLSYFNRTFRRRFGATPSAVRAARQDPASA
jgi:AraC-like DNA-binding protein